MPICLARVATSSCSVRMPSSTRTRPREWPTRRCSARAASSWAGETLPSSSRSCPSCLVWFAIAVRRACPRAPLQPPHAADQPLQHRLGGVGVGSTLRAGLGARPRRRRGTGRVAAGAYLRDLHLRLGGGGLRLGGGGLRLGGGGLRLGGGGLLGLGGGGLAGDGEKAALDHGGE